MNILKNNMDKEIEEIRKITKKNINFEKNFENEKQYHNWMESNYKLFGFDSLVKSNKTKFPDLILKKNDKIIRVELEIHSSNFILHKHKKEETDLVICIIKDKKIGVPILEINNFISKIEKVEEKNCNNHLLRKLFMCHPEKWIKTDCSMCERCGKLFSKIIVEVKRTDNADKAKRGGE